MLLINEYELENTGIQCCWKTVLPYIQMSLLFWIGRKWNLHFFVVKSFDLKLRRAGKISFECHHGCKTTLKKGSAHSSQTAYLSPEAPSNLLWQTDMRGIWKLSEMALCSQTAMSSYPALAWHSRNQRIKSSVNFTGRERSKDYFAWWDNLATTTVCLCCSGVCDVVGSKPVQV